MSTSLVRKKVQFMLDNDKDGGTDILEPLDEPVVQLKRLGRDSTD